MNKGTMKILVSGSEREIGKVIRENDVRVRRGLISITPVSGDGPADGEPVPVEDGDSKYDGIEDDKSVDTGSDMKSAKGKK